MSIALSLSIVSHGHEKHISNLLRDLAVLGRSDFEVVLTINLPEVYQLDFATLPYRVIVIDNVSPKGFAANHNAAFSASNGARFVILNPDIRLCGDPFEVINKLQLALPDAIFAPAIVNQAGAPEDSARHFPTPWSLARKVGLKLLGRTPRPDVVPTRQDLAMPDWVAGMFVVVPRKVYADLRGLSERYHMYYEDVDFCARARAAGYAIYVAREAKAIHEAQRDSHRKLRYFAWHVQSALKFFLSPAYLRISCRRLFNFGKASRDE